MYRYRKNCCCSASSSFQQCSQLTWSRKLLPKVKYSVGYVANIDAVSFGPYTVSTPPLNSIIASDMETQWTSRQIVWKWSCIYRSTTSAFEMREKQTIVHQVDKPWCHICPQQLREAVGHQPSPRHLSQYTETQSHSWVQMSTCGERERKKDRGR